MEEFEKLVIKGIDALPSWAREASERVAFLCVEQASREVLKEEEVDDPLDLFGLYEGTPLTERDSSYGTGQTPDTITIYRKPHEHVARKNGVIDQELLEKLVAETVWHEVGHFLGLSEEEVEKREQERGHTPLS